ncbi:MAG: 30S ribosomal protein S4 [Candidatus Harrisonbacteria bacterium CG10_big_fil_rev_8_21_14_0_10_40_38]|uniref:Small ribosomal subunit protein uS4 n=1 Tax=Candidatus Harrisonbacteria bacterium CG10_big_fil_rev_8_21_14_0_10_40_38 TaxID=1974583 RepID=A0A2H0US53_9BACT|nr:MAG: 30S ribosomal protein S4 [Candidatus Harrisonbacteria bacterium CG10_big_fil_rev_8_21_14_0_10_40_38]
MFNTREKRERALGIKLGLKPHRCASQKCAHIRRPTRPGVHGNMRRRLSDFGQQLQEKQKFQWSYGLKERTVRKLFVEALKNPSVTGDEFMSLLERRLDNVVYRLGFAPSRSMGRQYASHGHILVNGRKVDIPSYRVKVGDTISIREQSKSLKPFVELASSLAKYDPSVWLSLSSEKLEGKVLEFPKDFDAIFDVSKVVDYYSKYVK